MNSLDEVYNKKFTHLEGVKSLGWGSEYSQEKRFHVLLEIEGYTQEQSVLDFGCGYGDMSKYVSNYEGIDLRQMAVNKARQKYPNKTFNWLGIDEVNKKYDWIFASGIFCFQENWQINFETIILKLFTLCDKGVAVNFLSKLNSSQLEDMKYTDIGEVINVVKNLSTKFTIRHDYLPNDFTLYLYK
jgi:trans-aconitate methyltransferase